MAYGGGIGYNPRRKRPGGAGRGRPSPKPDVTASGLTAPPALTYDPGIDAKRRAAERGLEDIEADTKTGRHFARTDLAQALRDIRTSTSRSRGDINRTASRGIRRIDEEEADLSLKGARANQDFDTQLANIGRQFAQLGQRQRESANAAGVLNSGTEAAGQAARGRNQKVAEAPIATARQRMGEDLATALRRLGVSRSDLTADQDRELSQLHADRNRQRKLARRETKRDSFELDRKEERARREQTIGDADLLLQAIYEARSNRPGAFTKTGTRKKKGRR